jgi:hypothetical protein
MADTLIQLITGTTKKVVRQTLTSTFDLYYNIKKYFDDNNFDVNLKSSSINMPDNLIQGGGKCRAKAEYEHKLQKSIFNFIYRLKCNVSNPANQFQDASKLKIMSFLKVELSLGQNPQENNGILYQLIINS